MKRIQPIALLLSSIVCLIFIALLLSAKSIKKQVIFTFNQEQGAKIYVLMNNFKRLIPKSHMPVDTAILNLKLIDEVNHNIEQQFKIQTDTTKSDTTHGKRKEVKGFTTKRPS